MNDHYRAKKDIGGHLLGLDATVEKGTVLRITKKERATLGISEKRFDVLLEATEVPAPEGIEPVEDKARRLAESLKRSQIDAVAKQVALEVKGTNTEKVQSLLEAGVDIDAVLAEVEGPNGGTASPTPPGEDKAASTDEGGKKA